MCTKISIIVPVYDSMSDMETILESIDKQSFKEREVILVNLGNSKRALDKTKQHSDITLKQHIEETDTLPLYTSSYSDKSDISGHYRNNTLLP